MADESDRVVPPAIDAPLIRSPRLERVYGRLNRELFGGALPRLPIYESRSLPSRPVTFSQNGRRETELNALYASHGLGPEAPFALIVVRIGFRFLSRTDREAWWGEEDLRGILLHEMAHVSVGLPSTHDSGQDSHGGPWQEEMIRLIKRGETSLLCDLIRTGWGYRSSSLHHRLIHLVEGSERIVAMRIALEGVRFGLLEPLDEADAFEEAVLLDEVPFDPKTGRPVLAPAGASGPRGQDPEGHLRMRA